MRVIGASRFYRVNEKLIYVIIVPTVLAVIQSCLALIVVHRLRVFTSKCCSKIESTLRLKRPVCIFYTAVIYQTCMLLLLLFLFE